MISYNRVILTGRVAITPRRRYRPDGSAVVEFPLELNEVKDVSAKKGAQSNRKSSLKHAGPANRIDIVVMGEVAEVKSELLRSGQHLLVVGRLNQRQWQTAEGKKHTRTEVIATDLRRVEETGKVTFLKADEENR
ncbi:MAG: single-stranded DNA-binding protein [Syntrophaceae bacterium]|nr:single-stranded DNA-binding protein [Syntrophaceae bacterium]